MPDPIAGTGPPTQRDTLFSEGPLSQLPSATELDDVLNRTPARRRRRRLWAGAGVAVGVGALVVALAFSLRKDAVVWRSEPARIEDLRVQITAVGTSDVDEEGLGDAVDEAPHAPLTGFPSSPRSRQQSCSASVARS